MDSHPSASLDKVAIGSDQQLCLHVMTGEHYRETATTPAYGLVLSDGSYILPALPWAYTAAADARRQDGAMRTHCTSVRLYLHVEFEICFESSFSFSL